MNKCFIMLLASLAFTAQLCSASSEYTEEQVLGQNTPLHEAIMRGQIHTVLELLRAGAEVNMPNLSGSTPLHEAAWYGHHTIARELLNNGADIAARDEDESTPLHMATLSGHHEVCQLLLNAGADVNERNDNGFTPLYGALVSASWHRQAMIILFIQWFPDVKQRSDEEQKELTSIVPNWRDMRRAVYQATIELFDSKAADDLCRHTKSGTFPKVLIRLITDTMLGLQDVAALVATNNILVSKCAYRYNRSKLG